jgi:hypothetical protein
MHEVKGNKDMKEKRTKAMYCSVNIVESYLQHRPIALIFHLTWITSKP